MFRDVSNEFHSALRSGGDELRTGVRRRRAALDVGYLIRRAATAHPDVTAVEDHERALTMRELVDKAERLANAFDVMGVPDGASIGILLENRWEYVVVDAAIALSRRVRVALNVRLHLDDFRYTADDSDMKVLIHSAQFAAEAAALKDELGIEPLDVDDAFEDRLAASDPTPVARGGDAEGAAWITYTSGTTGRPKGVTLSHRSIREVAFNLLLELGPVEPGTQAVLTQPLSHGAGYFVLPWLIAGAGLYIMRRFDPEEVLTVGARPQARLLKVVPAMLPQLLDAAGDRAFGYDSVVYGASPIAPAVLERALAQFGPVLMQIYGQSEAPVTLTILGKAEHALEGHQRFSAGRAWKSVAVEVRTPEGLRAAPGERGEVFVRGSHMMTGYRGLPEDTAEVLVDGWVRTKDIARTDERGYVYLLGRGDEMIISGGYNISPREVERVLNQHPAVVNAVVFGQPDERWGQAVVAAVCAETDAGLTSAELDAFARPLLGFRAPKRIALLDRIPTNAYGKVDRKRLLIAVDEAGAAS
jgi:fatty-acyl-CoA synthase